MCIRDSYYVLFEDPDGIRFEVNFIPGAGLLKKGESFGSSNDYIRIGGKDATKSGLLQNRVKSG